MGLLDLALQQEQQAFGGEENISRYGAQQLIQQRTLRENERNAPLQLAATLAGHASDIKGPQTQQQKQADVESDMQDSAQTDPRDAKALEASQAQGTGSADGSSGLFGWLGKNLIGGFFGGSGGAGAAGAADGGG